MPVPAALMRIELGDYYRQLALKLRVGDELPARGSGGAPGKYRLRAREPVEMVGEYSVRGGILDVFSPEAPKPIRLDLFGDQVESIRRFDGRIAALRPQNRRLHSAPLTEWQKSRDLLVQLGELMREAGFHSRDLPPSASRFPAGIGGPHAPAAPSVGLFPSRSPHRALG